MYFISTRGGEKVTGAEALVKCLAKDGGLFVPETFPVISQDAIQEMADMSYPERAAFILGKYLADDLGAEFLQNACEKAYANFDGSDPVPLVKVDGEVGLYMLEVFRGPTCSIKDISLQLFPALLKKSCEVAGVKEKLLLLSATSGDAGKATLEAFRDVPNVKAAVFYPDESVVKMQRLQMSIQDGKNVHICAVKGNFDDCQKSVRRLLVSEKFNGMVAEKGYRLTSVSSLNIGRVLPQIAYYFSAYADMVSSGQLDMGEEIDFVVPTSNFDDVLACWYAKKMGLPVRKIVCASNRNRVLTEFFTKGIYDVKRNLLRTMSPTMDILTSNNVERLIFELSGKDGALTASRMEQLAKDREYSLGYKEKSVLDKEFFAAYASEDDTVEAMYEVFDEYGYAMDTHTGVALAAHMKYREAVEKENEKDKVPSVVLSVANPYKFPQDVLYALSGNDVKDSFKGIKRLNLLTAMKPPKSLLAIRYRPLRFKGVVANDLAKMADVVMRFVDGEIVPVPDGE